MWAQGLNWNLQAWQQLLSYELQYQSVKLLAKKPPMTLFSWKPEHDIPVPVPFAISALIFLPPQSNHDPELSVYQPLSLLLGNSTKQRNFILCVLSHLYTSWLRYSALGTPWHNLNTACTLQLVISQVSSNLEHNPLHNPLFLHMVLLERPGEVVDKKPIPQICWEST